MLQAHLLYTQQGDASEFEHHADLVYLPLSTHLSLMLSPHLSPVFPTHLLPSLSTHLSLFPLPYLSHTASLLPLFFFLGVTTFLGLIAILSAGKCFMTGR